MFIVLTVSKTKPARVKAFSTCAGNFLFSFFVYEHLRLTALKFEPQLLAITIAVCLQFFTWFESNRLA